MTEACHLKWSLEQLCISVSGLKPRSSVFLCECFLPARIQWLMKQVESESCHVTLHKAHIWHPQYYIKAFEIEVY